MDIHVPYADAVTARKVDRAAWAEAVEQLVLERDRGNKAAFGRRVGVDSKTVGRWIQQFGDVSEESVRQVARSCGINAMELLVRVGYYDGAEVGAQLDAGERDILETVERLGLPDKIRDRMLARYRARMDEGRRRALDEVKADLEWAAEQQRDIG